MVFKLFVSNLIIEIDYLVIIVSMILKNKYLKEKIIEEMYKVQRMQYSFIY